MPGITGIANTFNLPNYVGELFAESPQDTPFLSSIGGLSGGKRTTTTLHQWQGYNLRDAADDRQRLEGADAPPGEARTRFNVTNVVEIHQEVVEVSYTKLAATGQYATTASNAPGAVGVAGSNPVLDEADWQIRQSLMQIARDIEQTFITGTFAQPADNTAPRRTRGILEAIETNAIDADGAALTHDTVIDLLQAVWEAGGIQESETAALMCNGFQKRMLTKLFVTDANYQEQTRTVGGVSVSQIITDFGVLNVMLNRYMPSDTVAAVSLGQCAPVFLEIPGKGFLFAEPLAKVGAADRVQLYGEIGLEYGNEKAHGKITGLATAVAAPGGGS
ncbi:SU10 major capsid protein [Streptomyces harbinensis]|uniref:SU10 major capsid protein n=1 Tax=Streptomyces harbinensis TaxID=1176198 RepID=UPI00367F07CA